MYIISLLGGDKKLGTNYYLEVETEKGTYPVHLGKKSHGWHFLFDASGIITGLASAKKLTERFAITNEYGKEINEEEFWRMLRYDSKTKLEHLGEDNQVFEEEGYYFSKVAFS